MPSAGRVVPPITVLLVLAACASARPGEAVPAAQAIVPLRFEGAPAGPGLADACRSRPPDLGMPASSISLGLDPADSIWRSTATIGGLLASAACPSTPAVDATAAPDD